MASTDDSAAVAVPETADTADSAAVAAPGQARDREASGADAETPGSAATEEGASAANTPPERYVDEGVCPFECCTYRGWTARAPLTAYASEGSTDEVAFRLEEGEQFQGLTGDVIVDPVGVAVAKETVTYDAPGHKTVIAPGDTVYVLSHLGEGVFHVWHDGNVEEVYGFWAVNGLEGGGVKGALLRKPVPHWWAKVRNEKGQTGWLDMNAIEGKVGNVDACGSAG